MAELWWVRGGFEDDVLVVVRSVRRRNLHDRETRRGATWALALEATDELEVGLYSGCEASLSWKAAHDSAASGWLWWAWVMTA
jgi:hypothetical protein